MREVLYVLYTPLINIGRACETHHTSAFTFMGHTMRMISISQDLAHALALSYNDDPDLRVREASVMKT